MKYNLNTSFNSVTVDILDRSVDYASVPQLSSEVTIVHLTHRENKWVYVSNMLRQCLAQNKSCIKYCCQKLKKMSKSLFKQNGYVFYHTRSSDSTKFSMNFVTHLFLNFCPLILLWGLILLWMSISSRYRT